MSNKPLKFGRVADLNSTIRSLHDELKSLVLTCAPEFPTDPDGGLEFLADVTDLQAMIATYHKQLLVRLFQSASRSVKGASSILSSAPSFIALLEKRRKLAKKENRSEKEIDGAIRAKVNLLLQEMHLVGEGEFLTLNDDKDIPEMLYYLSTVGAGLCWYAGRYLARMTGELAKIGT
jgi:hypothetical protein